MVSIRRLFVFTAVAIPSVFLGASMAGIGEWVHCSVWVFAVFNTWLVIFIGGTSSKYDPGTQVSEREAVARVAEVSKSLYEEETHAG